MDIDTYDQAIAAFYYVAIISINSVKVMEIILKIVEKITSTFRKKRNKDNCDQ